MRSLALAVFAVVLSAAAAYADGEHGPMFGGAIIATRAADREIAGAQLELTFWRDRLGAAVEGSLQGGLDDAGARVTTLGGSVRVLLHEQLMPSLLEPREQVEFGIEAHGVVELAWQDEQGGRDRTRYGGGLALRLRGGTDFANVLAESRLFVRVLSSRATRMETIARSTIPESERELGIVIGLGAVFGSGEPEYMKRFRPRLLDGTIVPVN